jgi:tetratricopeptide (TPR) repeat protein
MMVELVSRTVAVIGLLTLATINWPSETRAQGTDELASLRTQVSQLHSQGKYAEAIPIAERYVALARRKHGDNHNEYATAIAWLAYVYKAQGRYADAEPLFKRSLAISEKAFGAEHPAIATARNVNALRGDHLTRHAADLARLADKPSGLAASAL